MIKALKGTQREGMEMAENGKERKGKEGRGGTER